MLKRFFICLISFILLTVCCLGSVSVPASAANDYTGPYVKVGNTTLPLAEHMPGTFFSKNGAACTCHYSVDCIANPSNCNCMRYYPTGNPNNCEIDLMAVQCFGFSRLVFYKCFGFIDQVSNSHKYHSVGSLSANQMSAANARALLKKAAPGAHVRLTRGHSVSILTVDDDFLVVYHGNSGGDGVASASCVVSTKRYTWEEFASYASAGILYVNMPNEYPGYSIVETPKTVGHYRINSDNGLRHRASPNTSAEIYGVIPDKTIIEVTEVDGYWGKTTYNGKTGWVYLEYTVYYSALTIKPSGSTFKLDSNGYLKAIGWKFNLESFADNFDKQSLVIKNSAGNAVSSTEYIGSGTTVSLVIDGKTYDTATVCLAGDCNGNGRLDVGDYIAARRAYFGTYNFKNNACAAAADVNGSGGIDARDYLLIKRYFFTLDKTLFKDFAK